jgi:uncharacterized protein YcbX
MRHVARWRGRGALRRTRSATLGIGFIGKGAFGSMEAFMIAVGRVAGLWRYPVKSMAAEELDGAEVSWHGLAGDRRWAFIRDGQVRSGFPWLTIRERPELAHYRPPESYQRPGRAAVPRAGARSRRASGTAASISTAVSAKAAGYPVWLTTRPKAAGPAPYPAS